MNNIKIQSPSVAFKGLIVKGTVSQANVKKLGDFASKVENLHFISDIEKNFEADAVLNNDITKMSFSHPKYGDLSGKYGCGTFLLENLFNDITIIMNGLKSSISKAKADFAKEIAEKEAVRRGC